MPDTITCFFFRPLAAELYSNIPAAIEALGCASGLDDVRQVPTHCAVGFLSRGIAYEAKYPRVTFDSYADMKARADLLCRVEVPVADYIGGLSYCQKENGAPYGTGMIFRIVARFFDSSMKLPPMLSPVVGAAICSQMVADCLVAAGAALVPSITGAGVVLTPQALLDGLKDCAGVTVFCAAT